MLIRTAILNSLHMMEPSYLCPQVRILSFVSFAPLPTTLRSASQVGLRTKLCPTTMKKALDFIYRCLTSPMVCWSMLGLLRSSSLMYLKFLTQNLIQSIFMHIIRGLFMLCFLIEGVDTTNVIVLLQTFAGYLSKEIGNRQSLVCSCGHLTKS